MNKNTKKFVVTLLSVLMVLSFMPTMAFAATGPSYDGGHKYGATPFNSLYSVDADAEGLTTLLAPTCDYDGVGQVSCTLKLNGTPCGAKRTVWINDLGHKPGRKIRLSATELMDYLKYTDDEKKAFFATQDSFCEAYVYACDNCDKYIYYYGDGDDDYTTLDYKGELYYIRDKDTLAHTVPKDIKECAASFTCTKCNVAGITTTEYNKANHDAYHADASHLDTTSVDKHIKTFEFTRTQYGQTATFSAKACVRLVKDTCKECGEEILHDPIVIGYKGGEQPEDIERVSGPTWIDVPTPVNDNVRPELQHAATKKVITKDPTCTKKGEYEYQCTECTIATESGEEDMLPHNYVLVPYDNPAGLPHVKYTAEVCTECGKVKDGSVTPVGFEDTTEYEYSYSVLAEANCEQGAWILVTETEKGTGTVTDAWAYDDDDIESFINSKDIIKINGKYYWVDSQKEIPYTPALGHEFGDMTAVADATCEERAIEGKVCSKCNTVDHATLKDVGQALGHDINTVTVDPTCGTIGYTFDACNRCKFFLNHVTGKATNIMAVTPEAAITAEAIAQNVPYNIVDPKVASGAPCTYEWKVLEEATAEKEGKQALVCTVCGHVKEGSETVIPIDPEVARSEAVKQADAAIASASDVLEAKSKYTADSIAAIQQARQNLETAKTVGDVAAIKRATEALNQAVAAAQKKAANTMTVKAKTVKAKANKATTIKKAKAFTVKKAKGSVTFKKVSGNKKISVSKAGKVVVKKGLKKGKTYKVKVLVTAAGNDNYLAKSKKVTLKVKIAKK